MEYRDYNDYELLDFICEGNEDANNIIIEKYTPLICNLASKLLKYCHNNGIDYNDLRQEGYIGLNYAIQHFQEEKSTMFFTYVKKCIERKMISAIIKSTRLKHKALNDSISFDDEDNMLLKTLKDNQSDPELLLEKYELEDSLMKKIKKSLTTYENQVFELYLAGFNYKEIAEILDKDCKAIDNAIQRIKIKVKKSLQNIENSNDKN